MAVKAEKAVDLTNLREITRGNKETECLLFEAFIDTSAKAIGNLKNAATAQMAIIWKEQAHFLKGAAFNMGACKLAALCASAEEGYAMGVEQKAALLEKIENEFVLVKKTLAAEI